MKIVFWSSFAALTIFYTAFQYFHRQIGYGDNAFLSQVTESIAHRGVPMSQVASAFEQAFAAGFVTPPETVCTNPLPAPSVEEFNYFRWHTYFVLYLFAPLVLLFGAPLVLSFFTSLSLVGMLALTFVISRKKGLPSAIAALMALLVFIHPGWSTAMVGQIYVDRFFLGLGLWFIATLDDSTSTRTKMVLAAILCTLLSDRFGLAVGGIIGAYAILFGGKPLTTRVRLGLIGLAFAVFSIAVIKGYIRHPQYAGFVSLGTLSSMFETNHFFERMGFFTTVNFLLFGVFAFRSPRYLLIAIALMIPNVLASIGGAEKTNFATHYHSVYFPILAFATIDGLGKIYRSTNNKYLRLGFYPLLVIMIILQAGLHYDEGHSKTVSDIRSMDISQRAFATPFNRLEDYLKAGQESAHLGHLRSASDAIPAGSRVSTPEFGISALATKSKVYVYPQGLDDADYLFVPYETTKTGKPFFTGAVNYLGAELQRETDACLTERIDKEFDVAGMKTFGGRAVLQRKPAIR